MALPEGGNTAWPPPSCHRPNDLYRQAGVWYSGDPDQLASLYTIGGPAALDPKHLVRPSQHAGGVVGRLARFFWGNPPPIGQLRDHRLHVPIAGDIAATSADLVFAEAPTFRIEHETTQARLEQIFEDAGVEATLIEGGELNAAYGDVYLRVSWDKDLADHPLFDVIPGDTAVPEWGRGSILTAVTFWKIVEEDKGEVWRHLERHEKGRVYQGLYKGTDIKLGMQMPLEDHPATAPFADLVDADGAYVTGYKGLTARHVPNMRPHRLIRGTPLGRSDYSPAGMRLMDSLDETYSSWMRDIRIGKGRLVVPKSYLQSGGRGQGAFFDLDQEVYEPVNAMERDGLDLSAHQFAIRVVEHRDTAAELLTQIVRSAGYSAQTFGEHGEGAAPTATEIRARQARSYTTRGRKISYWLPAMPWLAEVFLAVDVAVFKTKGVVAQPADVEWPDGVDTDPKTMAETLNLLNQAIATSVETRVRMLHQDWDETAIAEEVERVKKEGGIGEPIPDPLAVRPPDLAPDISQDGPGGFPPADEPPAAGQA